MKRLFVLRQKAQQSRVNTPADFEGQAMHLLEVVCVSISKPLRGVRELGFMQS